MATTVTVGGRTITIAGNNRTISIRNNTLYVDGVEWKDETGASIDLGKVLEIKLTGDPLAVQSDRSVTVNGSVGTDVNAGGSVTCRAVGGSVGASGSVSCDAVTGDVKAGGSVSCGRVGGSVKAGGSVSHG